MSEVEAGVPPAPAEVKPEQQPMETESAAAAAQPQQQQAGGDKQTVSKFRFGLATIISDENYLVF